jgi:hypothetical protein
MSISYSEREIFSPDELVLLRAAEEHVALIPEALSDSRCHEIARAVAFHLGLQHQDGYYGFVDHTWLWTTPFKAGVYLPENNKTRIGFPNILDVYCVGSLPMCRLVDAQHTSLPHIGWAYRPGRWRDDIDKERLRALIKAIDRNHMRGTELPLCAVCNKPQADDFVSASCYCACSDHLNEVRKRKGMEAIKRSFLDEWTADAEREAIAAWLESLYARQDPQLLACSVRAGTHHRIEPRNFTEFKQRWALEWEEWQRIGKELGAAAGPDAFVSAADVTNEQQRRMEARGETSVLKSAFAKVMGIGESK